ncbi:MAG: DUF1835 domain-containing protein [Oscillospiraceae bacterium]|nr:DUF1835 domain-containing protein [Oscillospiraceae bacterium]
MLEVLFGDSACGSMKIAQNYGRGPYIGGCSSIIFLGEKKPDEADYKEMLDNMEREERKRWKETSPMGGKPEDIFCFPLYLGTGDISEDDFWKKRGECIKKLFDCYNTFEWSDDKFCDVHRKNLKTLLNKAMQGEDIRVWYSCNPDELCGLYWFADKIYSSDGLTGKVYIVKLPDKLPDGRKIRSNFGWSEAEPWEFCKYSKHGICLTEENIKGFAMMWREIREENAPVRAVINGRLVGVREDFYDEFIEREIDDETGEFREAVVIGRVLGKYGLGISDGFTAMRINEMIDKGKLEIIKEADNGVPLYHRILCKNK